MCRVLSVDRVLVTTNRAETLFSALRVGIAPAVLFIRADGWVLGAPPFLVAEAERMYRWKFRLDIPDELRTIPAGHRACNACGGNGRNASASRRRFVACEVCKGKGYWSAKDIAEYHRKDPTICQQSCGSQHHDPV